VSFCAFFENDKTDLRQFFSRLEKHLFITTCIEKQCTRPLKHGWQSHRIVIEIASHFFPKKKNRIYSTYRIEIHKKIASAIASQT